MFIVIATILFLAIHQGQCGMNATSVLHTPMSGVVAGTLVFTQDNADSPVRITGLIRGLNPDSAHV